MDNGKKENKGNVKRERQVKTVGKRRDINTVERKKGKR